MISHKKTYELIRINNIIIIVDKGEKYNIPDYTHLTLYSKGEIN